MRGSVIGLGRLAAALLAAGPAFAAHHGKPPVHHGGSGHAEHRARHAAVPSAPKGATAIPASGIRLFCGPGRSPLMVRKMTQGRGTTVTVICR